MNPFYFGTSQRRLFGLFTPRTNGAPATRAIVVCHPWGQEYVRAHRSLRHLANLLARVGMDVLRFDYFGTGDSAGDMEDGDLAGWEADIECAIEEVKDTTGVAQVGLVGLRLGATLAAAVAARRQQDVDSVVLWDPVVDGDEYVDELWAHAKGEPQPGSREVLGFVLTERMAREMRAVDLVRLVPSLPARLLVVVSQPTPPRGAFEAALGRRPGAPALRVETIPSAPAWVKDDNIGTGVIPVPVLQRIVGWWG